MRPDAIAVSVILVAVTGCVGLGPSGEGRRSEAPQGGPVAYNDYRGAPEGYAVAGVAAAPPLAGVAAGIPYVERITGGAGPNDALPMIVALHPRGGSAAQFARIFDNFPARARIILPHGAYGAGRGEHYRWWEPRAGDGDAQNYAEGVRPVEAQMAAALAELRARRPTIGRPILCGFSQGATLAWALAVRHPEHVAAVFTFAGQIPLGFSPGVWMSPTRPEVHAYVGNRDPAINGTRASVNELRRMGIQAEIREYPIGHQVSQEELNDALPVMAALISRPGGP
jgi:phospholipase/carboxylesterase